jgi:ribosomal-protein-alanine N-acetyltransferase
MTDDYPLRYAYAIGNNIYLRYLTEEDARGEWHLWFNAAAITRNVIAQRWPISPEKQVEYLQGLNRSKDRLALAIVDRVTNKHIGIGSLSKIDPVHRRAEMSCVIGDYNYQNGIHTIEALAILTEIGLVRLNLHKLYATAVESSEAGIRLTRMVGYRESGRYREHAAVDGNYEDVIIQEIFQRDWLESPRRPKSIAWPGGDGHA